MNASKWRIAEAKLQQYKKNLCARYTFSCLLESVDTKGRAVVRALAADSGEVAKAFRVRDGNDPGMSTNGIMQDVSQLYRKMPQWITVGADRFHRCHSRDVSG